MIRCLNCFELYDESNGNCPHCGAGVITANQPIDLAPGTSLSDGRYIVGVASDSGGFGIIYKSWDSKLEMVVAIKEFYPNRLVTRAAGTKDLIVREKSREEFEYRKKRFLSEARNMAKFSSEKNIPNVFEYYEENNTAYIVMEWLEGESLKQYMENQSNTIDLDFALYIITEAGKALSLLHKEGIIHRDVAPDNIFICSDINFRIKLLDLGAARLADGDDDAIDIILKPGYSPVEQYDVDGLNNLDERSDIYSLAATLYYLLTGIKPDEATNRKIEDKLAEPRSVNPKVSENLNNSVMKAMAIDRHMRFKTVDDFLNAIKGEIKVIPLRMEKRRRKIKQITGVIIALLVITAGIIAVMQYYESVRLRERLNSATIDVWFSRDSDSEIAAMQAVKEDFESTFEGVQIELTYFEPDDYQKALDEALANNSMPDLFESTGVSEQVLDKCRDVTSVLKSEQAVSNKFLKQFESYYKKNKQIPLSINIPVVCIISNGKTILKYDADSFSKIDDFAGATGKMAISSSSNSLWLQIIDTSQLLEETTFLDNSKSSLLFTSTDNLSEIDEAIVAYEYKYVYCDMDNIPCNFTYEWSLADGSSDEKRAAEKLLSWMLGNKYQSMLLISGNRMDSLPICIQTFEERIRTDSDLNDGIIGTSDKFKFVQ